MITLNGKPITSVIGRPPKTEAQREASRKSIQKLRQAKKDRAALRENLRLARIREAQIRHNSKPILDGF